MALNFNKSNYLSVSKVQNLTCPHKTGPVCSIPMSYWCQSSGGSDIGI